MNNRFKNFSSIANNFPPIGVGSFLVATPGLRNSPFQKTVIFVLQHSDEGTFGVVLNRPADAQVKTAWQQLTGTSINDRCLVKGGPIGGPVFAIHKNQSIGELEMANGIFVSADSESFPKLADQDESDYRIVFGVAGWQAGQLADEIRNGKWYRMDAGADHVFDDPANMWHKFLRQYGRQAFAEVTGLKNFPNDPSQN